MSFPTFCDLSAVNASTLAFAIEISPFKYADPTNPYPDFPHPRRTLGG
jgi:hypothetical protein